MSGGHGFASRLRQLAGLAARGQWSTLRDKLGRRLRPPPALQLDARELWRHVTGGGSQRVSLHIAAALGGGADDVLRRRMAAERDRGELPLLLSLDALSGAVVASWRDAGGDHRARVRGNPFEARETAAAALLRVRCNSLVGFPEPRQLFEDLAALARDHAVPVTLEWHDHYLACPVHTLLDHRDVYCGLPDEEHCRVCLAANTAPLPMEIREGGIGAWRRASGGLLEASEAVIVFSESSADIIVRSHGDSAREHIRIEPHPMDYFHAGPVELPSPAALHVGVVGRIGEHKGAGEVAALLAEMERQGGSERLTLIGTCEAALRSPRCRVTGAYDVAELPQMIRETGVNVILVPSVCPETFSFVAHEVIAMQLPLLTYALGAQGEAASAYARGATVPRGDAAAVLAALRELYRRHCGAGAPQGGGA